MTTKVRLWIARALVMVTVAATVSFMAIEYGHATRDFRLTVTDLASCRVQLRAVLGGSGSGWPDVPCIPNGNLECSPPGDVLLPGQKMLVDTSPQFLQLLADRHNGVQVVGNYVLGDTYYETSAGSACRGSDVVLWIEGRTPSDPALEVCGPRTTVYPGSVAP